MTIKRLPFILMLSIMLITVLMGGGVYATWFYATDPADGKSIDIDIALGEFFWEGAEELPDNPLAGESHYYLVENIVDSSLGFNNPNSYLNNLIQTRIEDEKDNISSVAPTKGGNLKPIFSSSEIENLDFMIVIYIDDNGEPYAYDLYTFETLDKIGQNILISPVFKTVVEKVDGVFKSIRSYKGSARSMYYDTTQGSGKDLTVNPSTWFEIVG